jgi:hypothetical protein
LKDLQNSIGDIRRRVPVFSYKRKALNEAEASRKKATVNKMLFFVNKQQVNNMALAHLL